MGDESTIRKETENVADPGFGVGGGGTSGSTPSDPGGRPTGGGGGAGGGGLSSGDEYTPPDPDDGHRHAIVNFNSETGNGVTEVQGDGHAVPLHAHQILGWFVRPYRRGDYVSTHGTTG